MMRLSTRPLLAVLVALMITVALPSAASLAGAKNHDVNNQSNWPTKARASEAEEAESEPEPAKEAESETDAGEDKSGEKPPADKPEAAADKADAGKDDPDKDAADKDAADKGDAEKQKKEEPKKKAPKKRKTAKVEKKPLKVDVTVDGAFVARNMTPVTLRPEAWTTWTIEEIVPHGTRVRQGDVLVRFEAKKLNEEIAGLELSQRLTELSIRRAEEELPRVAKSIEMSLADAEQSHERINDDYKRYKEKDRDRYVEQAEMSLKMSKQRLDYARDELEQLEKMYAADDLTEETEEIILTRTRQQVEMSEYFYELAKVRHDELLSIYLPRQDEDNREVIDRADLSLERARLASQLDLNRARYELEQKRVSRDRSNDRHAKLVQDRGLVEIKAPVDGVVYYGRCVNGKWSDMSSLISKLQPHYSVPKGTTMMTIVETKPLYLSGTVAEKAMPSLEAGQPAKVRPAAEGAEALAGKLASVSAIPVSSGKFAVEVELTGADQPEWLVPGMSGKVKITTYDEPEALVLDKKAIQTEEDDEDAKYVWVVTTEGGGDDAKESAAKTPVKLGKTKGDLVEILDGLAEGDAVSLEDEDEWQKAEDEAKDGDED